MKKIKNIRLTKEIEYLEKFGKNYNITSKKEN